MVKSNGGTFLRYYDIFRNVIDDTLNSRLMIFDLRDTHLDNKICHSSGGASFILSCAFVISCFTSIHLIYSKLKI